MKLYYSPGACSLAAHILLEELKISYELSLVHVMQGEASQPAFLAINAKGLVPVLVDGDQTLTELPAILLYLSSLYPDKKFLPNNPLGIARVIEWLNWLSGTVHSVAYGQVWRPTRFIEDSAQFNAVISCGKRNIAAAYSRIEQQLDGRAWALGEDYSCVDPLLLVFYLWGNTVGLNMPAYPNWSAHANKMLERPAVLAAMNQEGLC
jgi:glutathione S-transferase